MLLRLLAFLATAAALAACGGGGGGGGQSSGSRPPPSVPNPTPTPPSDPILPPAPTVPTPEPTPPQANAGASFHTMGVRGFGYKTTSGQSGRLDLDVGPNMGINEFGIVDGDEVTFNFGSLILPPVPGAFGISVFDVFQTRNHRRAELRNLMRMLLTAADSVKTECPVYYQDAPNLPEEFALRSRDVYVTPGDLALPVSEFEVSAHVQQFLASLQGVSSLVPLDQADALLRSCLQHPAVDYDRDGLTGAWDLDVDEDGYLDEDDAFPWDADEHTDTDGDGIGDDQTTRYYQIDIAKPQFSDGEPRFQRDWLFDRDTRLLYLSNQADRSLSVIDIRNGEILRKVTFAHPPLQIARSADESVIYVLQMIGPFEEEGIVSVVNSTDLLTQRSFEVNVRPFDIAVTHDGVVVVSSNRRAIHFYDGSSGAYLSEVVSITPIGKYLVIEPDRNWLYTAAIANTIFKYEMIGSTVLDPGIRNGAAVVPGTSTGIQPAGDVFILPDGERLLTSNGLLYATSDLTYLGYLPFWVYSVQFDIASNSALIASTHGTILESDLDDLSVKKTYPYNPVLTRRTIIMGEKTAGVFADHESVYLLQTDHIGGLHLIVKPR